MEMDLHQIFISSHDQAVALVMFCNIFGYGILVQIFISSVDQNRMLRFRDWLRTNDADRDKYAQVKRSLAKNKWRHVQHYANAKTSIVQEIMKRANSNNA